MFILLVHAQNYIRLVMAVSVPSTYYMLAYDNADVNGAVPRETALVLLN